MSYTPLPQRLLSRRPEPHGEQGRLTIVEADECSITRRRALTATTESESSKLRRVLSSWLKWVTTVGCDMELAGIVSL